MSIESSAAFFAAIIIFAITPGPGVMALLARSMKLGALACITMAFGMTIGDVAYLTMAFYGLGAVATNFSAIFTIIRVVGAVYLIYLGWKMWRASVEEDGFKEQRLTKGNGAGFIQGFLISSSNPKVILFYIAFLPTFMDLTIMTTVDLLLLITLTIVGLMIGLMIVVVSGSSARKLFNTPKSVKRLNRVAGGIMASAGAYLLGHG